MFRFLVAFCLLTLSAHAADFERNLTIPGNADLYVSTGSGHIHIYPGSDNTMHIKAHVYAGWNAGGDIEQRIRRIAEYPPIQQGDHSVHLGEVSPQDRHLYNNITIDYEVAAPRLIAVNARSGSGDINVENVGRFLKAETGSGSVRVHGVAGPAELHTGSGEIELEQQGAGDVRAATGSGSIHLVGLSGELTARTGSGDIDAAGNLTGPARLQSGSGSIHVHVGRDAHLSVDATTGSGSIRVIGAANSDHHHLSTPINGGGSALDIHTGSGDIEVD